MLEDDKLFDNEHENTGLDSHKFGGTWTSIKLKALEQYLVAFGNVLKNKPSPNKPFTRVYIDSFAGTGRCDIKVFGERKNIDGSARIALATEPSFHKYFFIEKDQKKILALNYLKSEYPKKSIEIVPRDANLALLEICERGNWNYTRGVIFLDPYGLHVEWSTLKKIAETKAIDVWYLFPLAGIYRQMAKNSSAIDQDKENSITRILGDNSWKTRFYANPRQDDLFGNVNGQEREANPNEIVNFVSGRLRTLFPSVLDPKILYQKGDSGSPLFALYFCLSNPAPSAKTVATRIANHILKS